MLVIFAVLIGAVLATSALALRAPTTSASQIKSALVGRIEASRAHADAQTRLIAGLRSEINTAQAAALSQQSQSGLAADLSRLELVTGTVPVTGPGSCSPSMTPRRRSIPTTPTSTHALPTSRTRGR